MPTAIRIINDVIIPGPYDPFQAGLTPRESQTRLAFFIVAFGGPILAALFSLLTAKRWWLLGNLWSFQRLCALWFLSVAAFAAIVFFQPGGATRTTFVLAIVHGMVEISMISLLLGRSASESLVASMIFALVDLPLTFALPDMGYVFIVVAILGGANDFILPLLFLYGGQRLLAIGALAHTAAAVLVFTNVVRDYGVLPFTLASFFSLWAYLGFIIAGIRASRGMGNEYPKNPIKGPVPPLIFGVFVAVSLAGSTAITLFLAYVAPRL